jgi:hypothetical protein
MIKLISIILGVWAITHLVLEAGAPTWVPFAVLLYLVPSLLAVLINHPHTTSIVGLNLLLGWTFLCWSAALIWCLTEPSLAFLPSRLDSLRDGRGLGRDRWSATEASYEPHRQH